MNKLIHKFYRLNGEAIKDRDIEVEIDLENNLFKVGNTKLKIVEKGPSYKYTYKFLKKQVNVISKEEFEKHISKTMKPDSPFNGFTNSLLWRLKND